MEEKLIIEYSNNFDDFCMVHHRKSNLSQEHKAIAWRMTFILAKAIWGYEEPNYENISEVFKELSFPYNENSFKKFIGNSYEYYILEEDQEDVNNELLLEYSSYITLIEQKDNIAWFKEYCKSRNLKCSLDDKTIALLVDEDLYELVQDFGLPKRKEYDLMDKIFKIITFPSDQESYSKFTVDLDDEEIIEKIEKL